MEEKQVIVDLTTPSWWKTFRRYVIENVIKSNKQHIVMLPFSMGECKGVQPGSFIEVIEHPFLSIGSSCSILKPDIHLWLDNTIGPDSWDFGFSSSEGEYYICFATEAHKTWFMLRWS